jgi:hypothetical protein
MLNTVVNTQTEVTNNLDNQLGCLLADGIWYYDIWEQNGKPPRIYDYLVSNATTKVWIWDPYTNDNDSVLFENIKREVDVRCLTYWGSDKIGNIPKSRQNFINNIKLVQLRNMFTLEVRYNNTFKDSTKKNPFHDRYLFVDDNVYIVGSSMGYHHEKDQSSSSTAIHLVKEISAARLITERFIECWNKSNTEIALKLVGGAI